MDPLTLVLLSVLLSFWIVISTMALWEIAPVWFGRKAITEQELADDIKKLREKEKELADDIKKLQQEEAILDAEKKDLSDKERTVRQKHDEIDRTVKRMVEQGVCYQLDSLRDEISELKTEKKDLKRELQELQKSGKKEEKNLIWKINNLKHREEELDENIRNLRREESNLRITIRTLNERVGAYIQPLAHPQPSHITHNIRVGGNVMFPGARIREEHNTSHVGGHIMHSGARIREEHNTSRAGGHVMHSGTNWRELHNTIHDDHSPQLHITSQRNPFMFHNSIEGPSHALPSNSEWISGESPESTPPRSPEHELHESSERTPPRKGYRRSLSPSDY